MGSSVSALVLLVFPDAIFAASFHVRIHNIHSRTLEYGNLHQLVSSTSNEKLREY